MPGFNLDILLVFVMGCSHAGKSTFLDFAVAKKPAQVGVVTVGAKLRAKYLDPKSPFYKPDFFRGQAAPDHTREEAWSICEEGVRAHAADGKRLVLIDGQPRSIDQVEACVTRLPEFPRKCYLLLHANILTRTARLVKRFSKNERFDEAAAEAMNLGLSRLRGDMETYYTVLAELAKHGQRVNVVSSEDGINHDSLLDRLMFTTGDTLGVGGAYGPMRC